MSEQSFNQPLEDEISLRDIIDFLSESWKVIALGGILGGLLAAGNTFLTPPKYSATATFQVARVAGSDIEAPSLLLEKLKIPTYYSKESHAACNVMDANDPGETLVKNLNPSLSKTAPFINISYKEASSIKAQKCLENILDDIRNNQNLLVKPILEVKNNQLTNLKKKLEAMEEVLKMLPNKNSNFDLSDSKFLASALLLVTTLSIENDVKELRTTINNLEISLLEPSTMETSLIMPIFAPKQKVSPMRARILMSGVIAGLFLGLLFMIGRRSWHTYKTPN